MLAEHEASQYPHLEDDYADAWAEWTDDDQQSWDAAVGDGVVDGAQ